MVEGEVEDAEYSVQADSQAMVQVPGGTAIEAINRASVMTQVDVAKRYPRNVAQFRRTLKELATATSHIAGSCFYVLPGRGGSKPISGPSIRMAELLMAAWGNLKAETMLVERTHDAVIVRATVWDMQSNVAFSEEFTQSILKRDGNRVTAEMETVLIRAAASKALRNAVFKIVPRAYFDAIKDEIMRVAGGEVKDLATSRRDALAFWAGKGVDERRVLKTLRRDAAEDITQEDMAILRGLATTLKDGRTGIEELFPATASQSAELIEKLKKRDEPQDQPVEVAHEKADPHEEPAPKKKAK